MEHGGFWFIGDGFSIAIAIISIFTFHLNPHFYLKHLKFLKAKQICDIGRVIIELGRELQSPLIRFLTADTTIPMAIALNHSKTPQAIFWAVKARIFRKGAFGPVS